MSSDDAHSLSLSWAYGLNSQVPVHNMTVHEKRTAVLYSCSNTAVWYECHTERERLLQGHRNEITCLAVSPDKRWVVSADAEVSAVGCSVIIWDMRVQDVDRGPDATPVQVCSYFMYALVPLIHVHQIEFIIVNIYYQRTNLNQG